MTAVPVLVDRLLVYVDPFSMLEIKDSRASVVRTSRVQPYKFYYRQQSYHYARIRTLMETGWDDAVEIDVGIPGHMGPMIEDGCHRIIAAHYRGDETILAECGGWVSAINWLRGLRKTDPWLRET